MNELKFRALRQFNGTIGSGRKWVYSSLLQIDYERKILNLGGEYCQFATIGRFTGFFDNFLNEIYEGDVISFTEPDNLKEFIFSVYFDSVKGIWALEDGLDTPIRLLSEIANNSKVIDTTFQEKEDKNESL